MNIINPSIYRAPGGDYAIDYNYCDECVHLSPTEQVQDEIRQRGGSAPSHICSAYGAEVKHTGDHPHIHPLVYCRSHAIRYGDPAIDIDKIKNSRYDIALRGNR